MLSVILIIALLVVFAAAGWLAHRNWDRLRQVILERLAAYVHARQSSASAQTADGSDQERLTAEERSELELNRLHELVEEKKQIARKSDISHHLWSFYRRNFRQLNPQFLSQETPSGEWYDVRIRGNRSRDGLNIYEFTLRGRDYTLIDDEEKQGWREGTKSFSLSLYDDSERCLIEIPMRTKVLEDTREYFILTGGPSAFLPGPWIPEFTNVILKHQSIRNQEIRARMHEERLREIEELKDRFGISE